MTLELTFAQVCELVKKEGKKDPKLIEAVDALLGLAMVCSPALIGATAALLLPTLAVKNELVKIGKLVFDKVSKKKDHEYFARQQHMQLAYGLLVKNLSEFFEQAFDAEVLERLFRVKPAAFAVTLRLAMVLKSRRVAETMADCLDSSLGRSGAGAAALDGLPLSANADLRWITETAPR